MESGYFRRRSMSAERPLPSPTDTPYDTPRISSPRLSSFGTTAPSTPLTNSTTSFRHTTKRSSRMGDIDYDPEQITPTLHASLVSEILSLRRELDAKRDFIEDLEANLASTRGENDSLQNNLKRQAKEARAVKRELQLHEDGMLSAMEHLAKERDDVKDANIELRRRLDTTQKRLRTQEEDALRFKNTLEVERSSSASERRALERRADIAEQRLKAVIEEVAASQAVSLENSRVEEPDARPVEEHDALGSAFGSPQSTRSTKPKRRGTNESLAVTKPSLADELNFSDSNYEQSEDEVDHDNHVPQTSPRQAETLHERRPTTPSRSPQVREQVMAHTEERQSRVLGMVSAFEQQMRRGSEDRPSQRSSVVSGGLSESSRRLRASIRSSTDITDDGPRLSELYPQDVSDTTVVEEDQAQQYVQLREPKNYPRPTRSRAKSDPIMACQTMSVMLRDNLFRPTFSPLVSKIEEIESQLPSTPAAEVVSSSTQTDFPEPDPPTLPSLVSNGTQTSQQTPPPPTRAPPPVPVPMVPEIAVHPPSNPPSPPMVRRLAVLPSQNKNAGVQTPMYMPTAMKSVSIQTEAIRIDKRPVKLPPHLLPSALDEQEKAWQQAQRDSRSDPDLRPNLEDASAAPFTFLNRQHPSQLSPLHEKDDDLVPLEKDGRISVSQSKKPSMSKPTSTSAELLSGDFGMDDVIDDLYSSDTEFATRTVVSRPPQIGTRFSSRRFEPPAPLPEHEKVVFAPSTQARDRASLKSQSTNRSSMDRSKRFSKLTQGSDPTTEYQSRLGLMNRRGSARSRSPSLGSAASSSNYSKTSGARPPFIIPARRSSREQYAKIRVQRNQNPPSPTRRNGRVSPDKSSGTKAGPRFEKRSPTKFLRKTRSSAAIEGPGAPHDPPVPQAKAAPTSFSAGNSTRDLPKREVGVVQTSTNRLSALLPTGGASVGSAVQHNVVDAITATTIGEWMFKYMRKRKSFGVAESTADSSKTSEARHKRWVWLSPYERTIMWSNKQPRTNAALMGKAGRKLPIQSVLDVKDDTPPPKEAKASGLFDRSILILTPDRALKFTAPTKDRHYLWLTALSFLAHQSVQNVQNIPKFTLQPPNSPMQDTVTVSSGRSVASSIRNPLRSNKSKVSSQQSSGAATPVTTQQVEANARREPPKIPLSDSAFAPTVPRVPHSRKRSVSMTGPSRVQVGMTSSNALGLYSVATMNTPVVSVAGAPSVRGPSTSAASSRRSIRYVDEGSPVLPQLEFEIDHKRSRELSPRASGLSAMSAEFGGNNNFFDAVGVVRMDAFSKPANGSKLDPGTSRGASTDTQDPWGKRHERRSSSGSFIGPPDIGKLRAARQAGSSVKSGTWGDF